MAGEDIDLKLIIKALLDSKGFDEAQAAIKGMAGAANGAKPATQGLTDTQKSLNKELGGSRGAVADLTRVLLQNIGVTGPAGEAAKAAGTAMLFMGGGASALALAATGLVAIAAVLVPKIIEWGKSTDDTEKATHDLKGEIVGMLPEMEEYIRVVPRATAELKALFEASRDEAFRKQKKDIQDLDKSIADNEKEIKRLTASTTEWVGTANAGYAQVRQASAENIEKARELAQATEDQRVKLNALLTAEEDGILLGAQISKATDDARDASEKRTKALEEEERAQRALEKAGRSYTDVINERRQAEIGPEEERRRGELGALTEEQFERLTTFAQTEEQIEAERLRLIDERTQEERQAAAEKRALDGQMVAGAAQALGTFFGNTKAVRIAQAIADTYTAANLALATYPPPAGAIFAGIAIAQGLANVANIRKQEVGFDDPFSDMLAEKLGRKSAADFVRHFGVGFQGAMGGGGGGGGHTYNSTTIHRHGTRIDNFNASGYFGTNKTEFMKRFQRDLIVANRLEDRTRTR